MISFANVTVAYEGFTALPDFSLDVAEGEFFTLLGPSGCGKTTALRTLAGLETPTSGRITIAGRDVTRLRSDQRDLGMVFQNYALFPSMSVEENIAFGLRTRKVDGAEVRRRVREVSEQVELPVGHLARDVSQLSGGQQQRVAIARSLVLEPRILLLDEPLSNLDAKLRLQLRSQLKDLQRRVGVTTVYVTHDQEEALAMSDRVAVMDRGRVEQVGTPQEVYAQSATEFVCTFIGVANHLEPDLVELLRRWRPDLDPSATSYLRTEKVSVLAAGAAGPGAGARGDAAVVVPGTVASRLYGGTTSTYLLDCGALGTLRSVVREDGGPAPQPGDRVEVGVPAAHVLQFPAGGTAQLPATSPATSPAGAAVAGPAR